MPRINEALGHGFSIIPNKHGIETNAIKQSYNVFIWIFNNLKFLGYLLNSILCCN